MTEHEHNYALYEKCALLSSLANDISGHISSKIDAETSEISKHEQELHYCIDEKSDKLKAELKRTFDNVSAKYGSSYKSIIKNEGEQFKAQIRRDEFERMWRDIIRNTDTTTHSADMRGNAIYGKATRTEQPTRKREKTTSDAVNRNASEQLLEQVKDMFSGSIAGFAKAVDERALLYRAETVEKLRRDISSCFAAYGNNYDDADKAIARLYFSDCHVDMSIILKQIAERTGYRFSGLNIVETSSPELSRLERRYNSELETTCAAVFNEIAEKHKELFDKVTSEMLKTIFGHISDIDRELNGLSLESDAEKKKRLMLENFKKTINGFADEIASLIS